MTRSAVQAAEADTQGEFVSLPPVPIAAARAGRDFETFDWALVDSVTMETCEPREFECLGEADSATWFAGHYHRTAVLVPGFTHARLDSADTAAVTIDTHEIVLFRQLSPGIVQPFWRAAVDTSETDVEMPTMLRVARGRTVIAMSYCMNGTGGCWQEYLVWSVRQHRWMPVRQVFWDQARPEIPADYDLFRGIQVDIGSLTAEAPLLGPGECNACATGRAFFRLALVGDELRLLSVRFERHAAGASDP